MVRIKLRPRWATVALGMAVILSLVAPAYCEVSLDQASQDRAAILGESFSQLKDELERSFPREEALEAWANKIAAQYSSLWYILVANYENKLVFSLYTEGARQYAPRLQEAFRAIDKFTMKEGAASQDIGGQKSLVTREKLVIEMDTYYFEFGFGPIR